MSGACARLRWCQPHLAVCALGVAPPLGALLRRSRFAFLLTHVCVVNTCRSTYFFLISRGAISQGLAAGSCEGVARPPSRHRQHRQGAKVFGSPSSATALQGRSFAHSSRHFFESSVLTFTPCAPLQSVLLRVTAQRCFGFALRCGSSLTRPRWLLFFAADGSHFNKRLCLGLSATGAMPHPLRV